MRNKIKILFVVLAYLLNFAHDIQPHVHDVNKLCCPLFTSQNNHHHKILTVIHHDEDSEDKNSEHKDCQLPFDHNHLLDSYNYIQLRNIQTLNLIAEFSETCETIFCSQANEIYPKEFIPKRDINYYQLILSSSLSLRAPPANS